jgi:hypothetical protein
MCLITYRVLNKNSYFSFPHIPISNSKRAFMFWQKHSIMAELYLVRWLLIYFYTISACNFSNFLSLWQNTWEKQFKRKNDLFWLMMSRIFSPWSQGLITVSLALWQYVMSGSVKQSYLPHEGQEAERKGLETRYIVLKGTPPMAYFFQLRPHFLMAHSDWTHLWVNPLMR